MTTQAITELGTTEPKKVKGSPRWGDLILRIVAGLVLLYLFLPIFVIVLFSFNKPLGKFNYTWQGFTLDNWADPFKYPALTAALRMSLNVAAVSTAIALVLASAITVVATLQIAQVIILESFLSFLGLGVQPPTPAWGNMLGEGRVYMLNSWWIAAFPGAAIFVTTLVINLMGNALRDWLDPHMKL